MIPVAFGVAAKAFGGWLWALVRRVPWQAWVVLALLLGGWLYGQRQYEAGQAEVQARWDLERAMIRGAIEAGRQRGLELKKKRQERGRWILTELNKEHSDALKKRDRVIADLRTGALQLRKHWTCPRVPDAATGTAAGQGDAAADLRAAGAGDLVRLAAAADADIQACQRVITADREQFAQ